MPVNKTFGKQYTTAIKIIHYSLNHGCAKKIQTEMI